MGKKADFQQERKDQNQHPHGAYVAVLHDLQHAVLGSCTEQAIGRVTQTVQMQAA